MNTTTATSIRVFTQQDIPSMGTIERLAADLAATHGLGIDFVDVDSNAAEAIAAGVMGLPAIVAYSGDTEVARRECAISARGTKRWFERKVASPAVTPALLPAMA